MRTAAVLPVKRFDSAKQRLGEAVGAPDRRELAAAMVEDVLAALGEVSGLDDLIVVTAEDRAAALARAAGAHVVADGVEAGQSPAAEVGVEVAVQRGAERALLVPGDCPALDPEELTALLARYRPAESGSTGPGVTGPGVTEPGVTEQGVTEPAMSGPAMTGPAMTGPGVAGPGGASVVIVPDRHGEGTNALLLTPPTALTPAFGPGSLARHAALASAGGASVRVAQAPSLELDVDTPGDLIALRSALNERPGAAPRTRAVLERLAAPTAR
jgi:2-phospho-L-lactate/phosphoenolpyruvate guanylyltransferase